MILSANGSDFTIPGKNLKVSVSMSLVRKDLSGQTSSTETVSGGNKSQEVSVKLTIPKTDSADLRRLKNVAAAIDDAGDPVVYTIVDETCEAMDIRQVKFTDSFSVSEADSLRAWDLSFSLKETKSVAEQKEANAADTEVKVKKPSGEEVETDKKPNGLVEKLLGKVEKALP